MPGKKQFFIVLFCLTFFFHWGCLYSNEGDSGDFRQLSSLLERIETLPAAEQIDSLKLFIARHPGVEQAYWLLLNRYWRFNQPHIAEKDFLEFAQKEAFRETARWMLAIHYLSQGDTRKAREYLRLSIRQGKELPFLFTLRFLEFAVYNDPLLVKHRLVEDFAPSMTKTSQTLLKALVAFIQHDYIRSLAVLSNLSEGVQESKEVLFLKGMCEYRLKHIKKADILITRGLKISQLENDPVFLGVMLTSSGEVAVDRRGRDKALKFFKRAHHLSKISGDLFVFVNATRGYAEALKFLNRYHEAVEIANEAVKIAAHFPMRPLVARVYYEKGQSSYYLEKYHQALAAYDSAWNILVKNEKENYFLLNLTANGQGDIYKGVHLYELARHRYQEGLRLARTYHSKRFLITALQKLGDLLIQEKKYDKAIENFKEYVAQTGSIHKKCFGNRQIAEIYIEQKKYDQAEPYYVNALNFALKAKYPLYIGWCQVGMGNLKRLQGDSLGAMKYYHEALKIAREMAQTEKGNKLRIFIYNELGRLSKNHNTREAIRAFRRSAKYIEESRTSLKVEQFRIGFFSVYNSVYKNLAQCYFDAYLREDNPVYIDSIYYFMEMSQGRSLKDLSLGNRNNTEIFKNNTVYQNYQKASQKLQRLQRALRTSVYQYAPQSKRDSLLTRIELARYDLLEYRLRLLDESRSDTTLGTPRILTVSQIQSQLKKLNTGILQFQIGEDNSFVLAVTENEKAVIRLPITAEQLSTNVTALMSPFHQLNRKNLSEVTFRADIAHRLYRELFLPVEEAITLPENLVIVPDLAMTNLPLEMLLSKAPPKPFFTPEDPPQYAADFLQHRYIFTYSPTSLTIHPSQPVKFREPKVLVFANPFQIGEALAKGSATNFTTQPYSQAAGNEGKLREGMSIDRRFSPLAYAEVEASGIQKLSPSAATFMRNEFTEQKLRVNATRYDIIHIATHGFVGNAFDAFSGLVLALSNDSGDDGFLMGYEISDMNFQKCDLISLSACETGQGKLVAGEGVLGLPRLFLNAGAKSVMMTLWKVDDQFTSRLMPTFYKYLLKEHYPKAMALAAAKRDILNEHFQNNQVAYQHPVFWASFVLFGDPGNRSLYIPGYLLLRAILISLLIIGGGYYLYSRFRRNRALK